jgi:hypothetical protein
MIVVRFLGMPYYDGQNRRELGSIVYYNRQSFTFQKRIENNMEQLRVDVIHLTSHPPV